MFQKISILVLSFFTSFFSTISNAQENTTLENSLLWKISGNGLEKPSYIFGTIHMICNEDYFFTDAMKKIFDKSEKLVLEINLSDPNTIAQYQQGMMLQNGKQLKDFFSTEIEYTHFAEKLDSLLNINADMFQSMKPIVLLSLIAQKSFTCVNTASYEMKFIAMSNENNIPVAGLESTIAQLKIFDEMTDKELQDILQQGINDIENESKLQAQMIDAYKSQNLIALHDIIISSSEFKTKEDVLINDRNKNWVQILPNMMQEKSCFVAVGAGHLAGEFGLLNLLKKSGYNVEPIKN